MIKMIPLMMLTILAALTGCTQSEPTTAAAIYSDLPGHLDRSVSLSGTVVRRDSRVTYVWIGAANYFTLKDESGRLNIWYGIGMRCPPRIGSEVSVTGKVVKPDENSPYLFSARSVSIESSPTLGENEVRLCQLPVEELRIHEMEGPEALREHWKARGKPVRKIIYN